ncbi:hypothetical protein J2S16_003472 [Cytobacillus kochii]|nr:hypothetical protein [Cytobacillus kochii]
MIYYKGEKSCLIGKNKQLTGEKNLEMINDILEKVI